MQLKRQLFLNAHNHLKNQDLKTYQFLQYIGNELPEYFDEEDLAQVVYNFTCDLAHHPDHLPDWMQKNYLFVVAQLGKVRQLITVSSSQSTERFANAYERLLERHRKIED